MSNKKSDLMITCPACGYTFKFSDLKKPGKKIKCPACGYEIKRRPLGPDKPDFDQPIV
ncbi:MAG: zinc-ribbon domain-containing protein [Promethearchaeati archaeon]